MNLFTVSLFGHREICDLRLLEKRLSPIIEELILTKKYVSFMIGRNGEFDEYAASVIKRAQKKFGKENNDIILILPYRVSNINHYAEYYDSIIIPEALHKIHYKRAITEQNRWMIKNSDLSIFYVKRKSGGANTAMKYAEISGKQIINLCSDEYE